MYMHIVLRLYDSTLLPEFAFSFKSKTRSQISNCFKRKKQTFGTHEIFISLSNSNIQSNYIERNEYAQVFSVISDKVS